MPGMLRKILDSFQVGMYFTIERMITEKDTAANYGSHQLGHLIATPVYIDMMIEAAVRVVDDLLPEGLVSVGCSLEINHHEPTGLGMILRTKATLAEIKNDRLWFDIEVSDDCGLVTTGKHERAIVYQHELFQRTNQRLLRT